MKFSYVLSDEDKQLFVQVNDTHREKLFYSVQYKNGCLAASDLFLYVYTINEVLYIPLSYVNEYRCLKKVIHQIDSKKE